MKKYDFDEIIDRRGTGSYKFDRMQAVPGKDLIPLWVADMDFRTPDFITEAIRKRLEHPIFGYTVLPDEYFETVRAWVSTLHSWETEKENIRFIPGIVKGIGMVINAFLKEGDKVIIQPPVYHPFRLVPQKNGYEVVENPLIPLYEDGEGDAESTVMCGEDKDRVLTGYRMNFDHLEKIIDDKTRLLILANPHNPGGVAWSRETLARLAEITSRHNIIVISDEIHAEMMLDGRKHIPYACSSPAAASNAITFMAPSKTFNIAGIVSSYVIAENPEIREKFFKYLEANELSSPDIFSPIATIAAYRHGEEWRREMLEYIGENIRFTDSYLKREIPSIRCFCPQASFLVWLDCRSLGLQQDALVRLFKEEAGLYLNDGSMFGSQGNGFMRLNVATPRAILEKALDALRAAVTKRI